MQRIFTLSSRIRNDYHTLAKNQQPQRIFSNKIDERIMYSGSQNALYMISPILHGLIDERRFRTKRHNQVEARQSAFHHYSPTSRRQQRLFQAPATSKHSCSSPSARVACQAIPIILAQV